MSFTLSEIAAALGAEVQGDASIAVTGAGEPLSAGADELALAMSPRFAADLPASRARAALVLAGVDWRAAGLEAAIAVQRARVAMSGLSKLFDPGPDIASGVHPSAVIDPSATIGSGAAIGPFTVIGAGVRIGTNARIAPHVTVERGTVIGDDALLLAGVRIAHGVEIGHRFIAQPNAVIGGDGFSFVTAEKSVAEAARETMETPEGAAHQPWLRIHSLGAVVIGDDVEIGANSAIDRGTIRATRVGDGTKIDNLVQIGHNCVIGRNCLLCGMSGLAGSVTLGDHVVVGGRAAVADNLTIGDGAVISGGSGVASNVPAGRFVMGYPAVRMDQHTEIYKALRRLPKLVRDFRALQKAVSKSDDSD